MVFCSFTDNPSCMEMTGCVTYPNVAMEEVSLIFSALHVTGTQ